jgi:tankyrase
MPTTPVSTTKDQLRQLFEACKTGDLGRVKQLASPRNVNARDTSGRRYESI